jgi:hypothetical protein
MSDLLQLALKSHGGLDRWRDVRSLDVRLSLTGGLYRLKGYPEGAPNATMRVDARRPAVTITPYARPDGRGHCTPDRVWIEDGTGRVVDERDNPRDSFAGQVLETPGTSYTGSTSPAMRCGTTSRLRFFSPSPVSS